MILLVDDDTTVFRPLENLLRQNLRSWGVSLYHSGTLAEGLAEAKRHKNIKLVLLDLGMPCVKTPMDALAFIPQFPCSVAVYSAHADQALIKSAFDHGAVAYINKSDPSEVQLKKINEILTSIMAARVRMDTESREGFVMTKKVLTPKVLLACLGVVAPCVALISFAGGKIDQSLTKAKDEGKKEQETVSKFKEQDQHFERLDGAIQEMVRYNQEGEKWRRRMEVNTRLLLEKNGIQPSRDD